MGSYPVAYRAGAAVAEGFQGGAVLPKIPPAPGPLAGFLAGFMAMWKAMEILEQYPKPVDFGGSLDELYDAERVEGKLDAAERKLAAGDLSKQLGQEALVIPAMWGWTLTVNCEPCANQEKYNTPRVSSKPGQTCCSGYNGVLPAPTSTMASCTIYNDQVPLISGNRYSYRKSYTRNVGTVGIPSARPIPMPVTAPIDVADEYEKEKSDDLDRPFFPTAWSLPIRNSGQVLNPPRTWPWVRPVAVPTPSNPGVPGVAPLPVPVSVPAVTPAQLVNSLTRALSPPKPREKELKMRTIKALMLFKGAYGFVTELEDFACAMAKALPKGINSGRSHFAGVGETTGRGHRRLKPVKRRGYRCAQRVYEAWDRLNSDIIKQMAIEVIMNEIQDWSYGQFGKFNREVSRKFFGQAGAPFGFQTAMQGGGGGKQRMTGKIDTEKLRPAVTYMVNTMWAEGFEGIPFRSVKQARKFVN